MKMLFAFMIVVFCLISEACRKNQNEATYPASVDFELTDKNGNSLIKSLKDTVKVSYIQDGVLKYINLHILKLQVSSSDTTTVKHYNGLLINDGAAMSGLSGFSANQPGTIHDFVLYLNGVQLGSVYLNYWNLLEDSSVYSQYCTFNNMPCKGDRSFDYFAPGSSIILLQMQ